MRNSIHLARINVLILIFLLFINSWACIKYDLIKKTEINIFSSSFEVHTAILNNNVRSFLESLLRYRLIIEQLSLSYLRYIISFHLLGTLLLSSLKLKYRFIKSIEQLSQPPPALKF